MASAPLTLRRSHDRSGRGTWRWSSTSGGHLGPGLGVVELTLALYQTLDLDEDRVVWDVGHQAYPHKLITGRYDDFHTLRQKGGVAGYLKRSESRFDHFGAGHASTCDLGCPGHGPGPRSTWRGFQMCGRDR